MNQLRFIGIVALFALVLMINIPETEAASIKNRIIHIDSTNGTDTMLSESGPDTVRGTATTFGVHSQGAGVIARGLINLSFLVAGGDYIPSGATCDGLVLELKIEELVVGAEANGVHMFPFLVEWSEGVTTWNTINGGGSNQSTWDGNHSFIQSVSPASPGTGDRFNLTIGATDCQTIIDNTAGNRSEQSFLLQHPASETAQSGKLNLFSSDHTTPDNRWKIYINYTEDDTTEPSIKMSLNASSIFVNDIINITANVTDDTLSTMTIKINFSSGTKTFSYADTGTSAEISNATSIIDVRGHVLNFSIEATDAAGNVGQNSTILTVSNTAPVLTSVVGGAKELEPFDSSLKLYLDMDDITPTQVLDRTSNNNDGTIVSANRTFGKQGWGMVFDGVDDSINVDDDATLDFGSDTDFTAMSWFKSTSAGAFSHGMWGKKAGSGGNGFDISSAGVGGIKPRIRIRGTTSGGNVLIDGSDFNSSGVWAHMAVTFDRDGNALLYINGVLDSTATTDISGVGDINNNEPFKIGFSNNGFKGTIDEVLVF